MSTIDSTITRAWPASQRRRQAPKVEGVSAGRRHLDIDEPFTVLRTTAPATADLSNLARGIVDGSQDLYRAPERAHAAG